MLLLDLSLPDASGLDVLREIREATPEARFDRTVFTSLIAPTRNEGRRRLLADDVTATGRQPLRHEGRSPTSRKASPDFDGR